MIYSIQLTEQEESITLTHYEGDPVKLKAEIIRLNGDEQSAQVSLLEKDVRQLINALVCTTPQARQFIHEDRYGREWKAKTMGLKKEELVDQLQKTKVENLWLMDQIRMRSQWDWEPGIEGGGSSE
jgi:hypothetical protein